MKRIVNGQPLIRVQLAVADSNSEDSLSYPRDTLDDVRHGLYAICAVFHNKIFIKVFIDVNAT